MEWQWSVWVVLELAATIGMLALTYYSRNTILPRVRNLGLLLFTLGTLYMFLHAMEIGTTSLELKYLYFRSQIVTLAITATIWLAFILQYVHENYRFTGDMIAKNVTCILYGPAYGIPVGYCVMSID